MFTERHALYYVDFCAYHENTSDASYVLCHEET